MSPFEEPKRRASRGVQEFYVGYLPLPRPLGKFLLRAVPLLAAIALFAGVLVAFAQRSPGTGQWDASTLRTYAGTIVEQPYPMLLADDAGDGRPGFVLLVSPGKHGAQANVRGLGGRQAEVRGTLIHRDARRLVELEPGPTAVRTLDKSQSDALTAADQNSSILTHPLPAAKSLGRVTLRGEIIDPKCFLGAMKPGAGKTHKECAALCITGGIPPMFLTRDRRGAITYYLLEDPTGGPLSRDAYPFIADAVEIDAELMDWCGTAVLRVSPDAIRRI